MDFRSGTTGTRSASGSAACLCARFPLRTAVIAGALFLGACGGKGVPVAPLRPGTPLIRYEHSRPSMGGTLTIGIVAPEGYDAPVARALETAFGAADRWESLLSEWVAESPVSQVNASAGKAPVAVPKEVIATFKLALTLSHASRGAFDVTVAGMGGLWDFRPDAPHTVPTLAEREAALAHVNWTKVQVDEQAGTVFLPEEGMKAGFGGLGRGIGADAAAVELEKAGFGDFFVDLSGDAFYAGDAGGKAWSAKIPDPRGDSGETVATVQIRNQAVETSGDYETFFIADGVRYHPVLDARTGAPSRGLASVTVVADDATTADGYGTAILAAGPTEGLALLLARKLQGVLITAPEDGAPSVMMVTRGLEGRIDTSGWDGRVVWVGDKEGS